MRQNILIFGGILLVLLGIIFLLQGLNVIQVPASSTMIGEKVWAWRGAAMIVAGALLAAGGRLTPDKKKRGED